MANDIQIPEGWEKEILLETLLNQDIIKLDRGRVISSIDLVEKPGIYPVYSSSAQKNGFFGAYGLFDFDEELITWSVDGGGYFFYRPKHKFSVTNVSGILKILDEEKYNYKFLYYLLAYQHSKEIFDYVDKAHPSVIKKRYKIPVIDLTEQKKIAEILSKVDKAIEQTQQLIEKYGRIKTGLMQDLLTKGIDENGNIRSEETHEFKDSELGRIPVEWEINTADNLFDMILGKMLNKIAKIGSEQFEYLGNKDVKWGDFNLVNLETMNFNSRERIKFKLKYNDLLVCEGGDVGRCAIWREKRKNVFFQKAIHRLRPKTDEIIIDFMFEYMSLFVKKSIFNDYVSQTSIKHFTQERFKQIPVLIPLKNEQEKIIKFSLQQNQLIILEKEKYSKLQSIKTALMQDLLSGKKRVSELLK